MDISKVSGWFKDHRSDIEFSTGMVGMLATVVLVGVESVKFYKRLEKDGLHPRDILKKETRKEVAKTALVSYAGGAAAFAGSAFLLGDSKRLDTDSIQSLTATLNVTTRSLHSLRNEVVENLGEKKLKELDDSIAEKASKDGPPPNEVLPKIVPEANLLVHDIPTGRWYWSTIDCLNKAINSMDTELNCNDGFVPVSTWLELNGLDGSRVLDRIYIKGSPSKHADFANSICHVTHTFTSNGISLATVDYYIYNEHGKELY